MILEKLLWNSKNSNISKTKLTEFPTGNNIASGNIADENIEKPADGVYKLKAVLIGNNISYYINDVLVCNTIHTFKSGYLGLNIWNANVEFTDYTHTSVHSTTEANVCVTIDASQE